MEEKKIILENRDRLIRIEEQIKGLVDRISARPCNDHEGRIRTLEKWQFKAVGAVAILVIIANYIINKFG